MKVQAVLILCLAVSVLANNQQYFETVREAFKSALAANETLSETERSAFLNFSSNADHFIFTSDQKGILNHLVKRGVPIQLAAQVVQMLPQDYSDEIRVVGPVYYGALLKPVYSAVCAFKNLDMQEITISFVCVMSNTSYEAVEVRKTIARRASFKIAYLSLKAKAQSLPNSILDYHAWTSVPIDALKSLRGDSSQRQLDSFLRDGSPQREKIEYELNSKKNDPLLAKLFKNGLQHFSMSTSVQSVQGVRPDALMNFAQYLIPRLEIPANAQRTFLDQMYLASITDMSDCRDVDFIFNTGPGRAKYVAIISATDPQTKFMDFIIVNLASGFELGPDVIASTKSHSLFWGLISWTDLIIKYNPASLNRDSIELLFKFFKVSSFDKIRAWRGIK